MLAGGEVLDVRNVIWATGFREGYDWVQVPGFMGADGWPVGTRGVADATPGLYVLGVPFTFGFTSMLVAGAGRDAKYVVARLADRSAARSGMRAAAIAL
jgi:putative flavoprotein involved in K+ transport